MHFLHHLQKVWILFKFGYLKKSKRLDFMRHSHVAHCIELGFSPVAIAERMGHEGINITFNYAHLYPSKQKALADKLNEDRGDVDTTEKKEAE